MLTPLLLMAVVGTFAYEYQVVLPLFAWFTFGGNAGTYATMTATMGAGAIIGGLITAWRRTPPAAAMARIAVAFGALQLLVSLAPSLPAALIGLFALGAVSIGFLAIGNSTLQLAAAPEMRGRVMGLWAVAFVGSTPLGGPIVGWVGEHVGARYALGMGGIATSVAALLAMRSLVAIDSRVTGVVRGVDIVPPPPRSWARGQTAIRGRRTGAAPQSSTRTWRLRGPRERFPGSRAPPRLRSSHQRESPVVSADRSRPFKTTPGAISTNTRQGNGIRSGGPRSAGNRLLSLPAIPHRGR